MTHGEDSIPGWGGRSPFAWTDVWMTSGASAAATSTMIDRWGLREDDAGVTLIFGD